MAPNALQQTPSNHPQGEDLIAYLANYSRRSRNRTGWTPRQIGNHIVLCPACVDELEKISTLVAVLKAMEAETEEPMTAGA